MKKIVNILISGAKGYIGSKIKYAWSNFFNANIETCDLKDGTDIMNYTPKSKLHYIFHFAGQAGAIPSEQDTINDARQNILGTIKAIKLANKHKARLIFPASASALNVKSPYGLSKRTAEDYIKLLCEDYVILRLSSIYGGKPVGVVDNFIREEECTIYGDGKAVRDFVHIDDIVSAFVDCVDWEKGFYNCGSGKGTKIIDLAKATGKTIVFKDKRDGEILESVLENTTPDWKPKIEVIDYIKDQCKT